MKSSIDEKRRAFLSLGIGAIGLTGSGVLAGYAWSEKAKLTAAEVKAEVKAASSEYKFDESIQRAIKSMRRKYGLGVDFSGVNFDNFYLCDDLGVTNRELRDRKNYAYIGTSLDRTRQRLALGQIAMFAEFYPIGFFKEVSGLKEIKIVDRLSKVFFSEEGCKKEEGTEGVFIYEFMKEFIMELTDDVSRNADTFVHETHHQLEKVHNVIENESHPWEPSSFRKKNKQVSSTELPQEIEGAFFTSYGMSSSLEDRASIAELLFFNPARIADRLNKAEPADKQVLLQKLEYVKDQYETWSGGAMNSQYWEDMNNKDVKVDYSYWAARASERVRLKKVALQ